LSGEAAQLGENNWAINSSGQTVSFQELVLSNMLTLNALVELLDERGILAKPDVLDRVKQLQAEMSARQKLQ
jgi:hypothetical protein